MRVRGPAYDGRGMKQLGFTLMLFVVVLSPLAAVCQLQQTPAPQSTQPPGAPSQSASAPAQPAPLSPPDKDWRKIQKLPYGVVIDVSSSYGPDLRCRFAAATDDALFCNDPGSAAGTGWRFDRARVISVAATVLRKNHHPGWIAATLAGGLVVGLLASRGTSAGGAATAGLIGAGVVGVAGAPLALSQPDEDWVTVVYRPRVSQQSAPAGKTN
jgi:hypothetical protein